MKNLGKIALALGGLSAVCAGFAVGTVASTQKEAEVVKASASGGTAFYLTPKTKDSDWTANNAKFGLYFYNSETDNAFSDVMTSVEGNTDGVYETNVPTGTWSYVIAIRLNDTATSVSWANKWNQTQGIALDGTFNGLSAKTLNGDNSTCTTYPYLTSDRINLWGKQFSSALSSVCVADGSTDTTALQNAWTIREEQYSHMGSEVKTAIHDGVASLTGSDCDKALSLYDYVEGKYNPTGAQTGSVTALNFIGRTVTPLSGSGAAIVSNKTDSSSALVLGGLAAVALLAAGSYFFVRKKKVD